MYAREIKTCNSYVTVLHHELHVACAKVNECSTLLELFSYTVRCQVKREKKRRTPHPLERRLGMGDAPACVFHH